MRVLLPVLALGAALAALAPPPAARAWWDGYGRWHPNYRPYYRPPVAYAPPAPYYGSPYYRGYAHWVPPHYNRWGRFIPGHWV